MSSTYRFSLVLRLEGADSGAQELEKVSVLRVGDVNIITHLHEHVGGLAESLGIRSIDLLDSFEGLVERKANLLGLTLGAKLVAYAGLGEFDGLDLGNDVGIVFKNLKTDLLRDDASHGSTESISTGIVELVGVVVRVRTNEPTFEEELLAELLIGTSLGFGQAITCVAGSHVRKLSGGVEVSVRKGHSYKARGEWVIGYLLINYNIIKKKFNWFFVYIITYFYIYIYLFIFVFIFVFL